MKFFNKIVKFVPTVAIGCAICLSPNASAMQLHNYPDQNQGTYQYFGMYGTYNASDRLRIHHISHVSKAYLEKTLNELKKKATVSRPPIIHTLEIGSDVGSLDPEIFKISILSSSLRLLKVDSSSSVLNQINEGAFNGVLNTIPNLEIQVDDQPVQNLQTYTQSRSRSRSPYKNQMYKYWSSEERVALKKLSNLTLSQIIDYINDEKNYKNNPTIDSLRLRSYASIKSQLHNIRHELSRTLPYESSKQQTSENFKLFSVTPPIPTEDSSKQRKAPINRAKHTNRQQLKPYHSSK